MDVNEEVKFCDNSKENFRGVRVGWGGVGSGGRGQGGSEKRI